MVDLVVFQEGSTGALCGWGCLVRASLPEGCMGLACPSALANRPHYFLVVFEGLMDAVFAVPLAALVGVFHGAAEGRGCMP